MLNPPIENYWKYDAIKKFEKMIFKTIDTSSKSKEKIKTKKKKEILKESKNIFDDNEKEKEKCEKNYKKGVSFRINPERAKKIKDKILYEIISGNNKTILLKKKKLRENNIEVSPFIPTIRINEKEKSKITKIMNKRKIGNKNENILDFDRILEEVFDEKAQDIQNYSNLISKKSNKIKIETNIFLKDSNFNNQPIFKDSGYLCRIQNSIKNNPEDKKRKVGKLDNKQKKAKDFNFLENNNTNSKKLIKFNKTKIKKIKKPSQRRDSNLYDINNFVVQNNTNKINEKKDIFNIPIPVFRELDDNYYDNFFYENEEITNDESYLKFHRLYEKREFDFRLNFYKKKNHKQKTESFTPQENTSVQESNTIDSVIRINCSFLQEDAFMIK